MRVTILVFLAAMSVFGSAMAWQEPKVDYSADWKMETADGAQQGRIYATRNKERREIEADGEQMVLITRLDKKLVWSLMPSEAMYIEMKLGAGPRGADDLHSYDVQQTPVGEETVDGVKTTKSKIIMKGRKGDKMGGFWWITKDGIVMKLDVISVEKKRKERMTMELSNLKLGPQPASLFEVPAGYSKMAGMPGMSQMMGGGQADKSASGGSGGKAPAKDEGFGLKDALKLFR